MADFVEFYVIDPATGKPATGLEESITVYSSEDFGTCTELDLAVTESQYIPGLYEVPYPGGVTASYETICPQCTGYFIKPVTVSNIPAQKNRTFTIPIYIYDPATGLGISGLTWEDMEIYVSGEGIYSGNPNSHTAPADNRAYVHEVDSVHAPGLYSLDLTNNEMGGESLTIYTVPNVGYASPEKITLIDLGAQLIHDIDVTDHAYDWIRYNIDQTKACMNRVISYLGNWAFDGPRINFYDSEGSVVDRCEVGRNPGSEEDPYAINAIRKVDESENE